MLIYQSLLENMFKVLLSDALSEPSDEEILVRALRSQWVDLHAFTRHKSLKFETPGFELSLIATGE